MSIILLGVLGAGVAYLVIGTLWHRVLAPFPAPDPATFPRAGDRFASRAEGVVQVVDRIEAGVLYGRVTLAPGAKGPPLHVHDTFDETFQCERGTLFIELADRVVQLRPGETLHVPAGTPHRPFNPTAEEVSSGVGPMFPVGFAAMLVQLYHLMDTRGTAPLTMLLQLSVIDPLADTHLARVPRPVTRVLQFLLAPAARLLGYRNYRPEWALHPSGTAPRPMPSREAPQPVS